MKKSWLALVFGSALFLAACGGNNEEGTNDTDTGTNEGTTTEETASADGEALVQQNCTTCHGGNLEGMGGAPKIADVGSRLSEEEILNVINNGQGGMPPGILKGEEAEAAAAWLATQK